MAPSYRISIIKTFQFVITALLWALILSVDRGNFKKCDQSGFCKRNRNMVPGHSPYSLDLSSLKISPSKLEGHLKSSKNNIILKMELFNLEDSSVRLKINELNPIKPRYEVVDSLVSESHSQNFAATKLEDKIIVRLDKSHLEIQANPFQINCFNKDVLVMSINSRGLMKFEHLREKSSLQKEDEKINEEEGDKADENELKEAQEHQQPEEENEPDMWEEHFKGFTDSKPNGPSSVGLDFTFVDIENVYGIPEHADSFSLKSTSGGDPYRLYNLDVFEYEVNNPMALYGSVPVMVGHGVHNTIGLFWNNVAETWIDVKPNDQGVVDTLMGIVKGSQKIPQTDTHWFSESGIIDVFIFLGPRPKDIMRQYARITGTQEFPPLFAISYHQCRWNYLDQDDVRNVDAGFDENDIPYDVLWLDIEHTDGKRYFTWDSIKFSDPIQMINNISAKGRKMVTIVDPHIKRDDNYIIHQEARAKNYYVKNKDDQDFEGWCWPGSSSYVDSLNPEARDWWASKFSFEEYKGSTPDLFTWNDMNEPSVFNGPEITMPKDCKHYNGLEHREIHNIYGLLLHMSTYNGQLRRSDNKERTFILTRAFFAGSQRYAAVWTGDNTANWEHLQISIPMILSLSVTGLSFAGADVGGFFQNPDKELLIRWYQAGAYQPFFRAHAHMDTARREPWLFGDEALKIIRNAIRTRYAFLPYWYTLFFEAYKTGVPPMRPLWMEFPEEKITFKVEDEHLIGDGLLVHPVVHAGISSVDVLFPGDKQFWYDIDTYRKYSGISTTSIQTPLNKIPVFYRGGTIIPRKERIRRCSSLMNQDPITLIVALDKNSFARGTIYIDDGHSFQYRKQEYIYRQLIFENNMLSSNNINADTYYQTLSWLERVIILGLNKIPKNVTFLSQSLGKVSGEFTYNSDTRVLVIRKPGFNMGEDWSIELL